ncbi:hypothetical protein FS837_004323 [Tulasnella sp. UAMH 9824]|nr:hypothetical protein FS837_004323 [Tulasnella sp. UAMH 9824]
MNTATLWAMADWRCSPSQLEMCLERSQNASIAVRCYLRGDKFWRSINASNSKWDLDGAISEHISRWRDAEFFVHSSQDLENVSELAAPQLQRLAVNCRAQQPYDAIHLFGGKAPNLKIIDLHRIYIHWEWDPVMIANLRSMELHEVRVSEASVGCFLSMIQSSDSLEKLTICLLRLDGAADQTRVSPSWFNRLKEIEIMKVAPDVLHYLLGTIRAPHVRNIAVDFPYGWKEDWGQLLLHCVDYSIIQHVKQAQHIELWINLQNTQIALSSDLGPPVSFGLTGDDLDPVALKWMLDNVLVHRNRSTLRVRFSTNMGEALQDILPSLLQLHDVDAAELEMTGLSTSWSCCPQFLGHPVFEAGRDEWVWPRLTSLTVRGRGWMGAGGDILAIVKARLEASSGAFDTAGGHEEQVRPAAIQTLRIKDLSVITLLTVRQLENLVPDIRFPPPANVVTNENYVLDGIPQKFVPTIEFETQEMGSDSE